MLKKKCMINIVDYIIWFMVLNICLSMISGFDDNIIYD
jgi:hypothetical protein